MNTTLSDWQKNVPILQACMAVYLYIYIFCASATRTVNNKLHVDFANAEANKALTRAILQEYYQIEWDIPLQHLCPAVPNRLYKLLLFYNK